nr:glycerophosphodiester phosphodiesterase family protein [Flavihumibacter rivuli]
MYSRFLAACILLASCNGVNRMNKTVSLPAFDKEGHRGCRGLMPENTIPAMLKALDLGVTTLEMDAVVTADGKVILSHEPFFNHEISTRPDGVPVTEKDEKLLNIYRMDYATTLLFDVGMKPHPRFPRQERQPAVKPLLADVITAAERHAAGNNRPLPFYNIETKSQPATDSVFHPAPGPFVDLIMDVVKEKGVAGRVIIQSFDFRTLKVVHQKYPSIRTAALIEPFDKRTLQQVIDELGFKPSIYSPNYILVNEALVSQCKSLGIKLIPWTVNDKSGIERLMKLGVDGIITDYPDLF